MCGIAGMAGRRDPAVVERMCEVLVHRGPDDQGIYSDRSVALGMRRLAIIDLAGGRQPIHNEDKSVWIVFNGEIYNYQELRSGLIERGHRFTTLSDTEVIVHLYEEEGEACLNRLQGMFALALWDREAQRLLVARDRLGIKPLVYSYDGERLLFASEINALLAADPSLNELDPHSLNYFLAFLYVPAPKTIFAGIRKLPPGHLIDFSRGRISVRRYWRLDLPVDRGPSSQIPSREEYEARALSLLEDAVRMRLISEVPLGAFLSGGMDSASLVAFMAEHASGPVRTFTIGYGEEDASYNELASARRIAEAFGTRHREFVLEPDMVDLLPEIVGAAGEPFADSSAVPTYLICRETRRYVTVALSGIGGDEVFLGYPRYLGARLSRIYDAVPYALRRHLLAPLAERLPENTQSRNLGGWIKRFARGGLLDPVGRYLQWITFLGPRAAASLYTDSFREVLGGHDVTRIHRGHLYRDNRIDYVRAVSYLDLKTYLPDDLLFMGDAMSMAHSLELRVPFCDHRLVEFLAGVPTAVKLRGFGLKSMLKSMMKKHLPREILHKKKQGFMVPIGSWFRRGLEGYLRETLLSERALSRGFFRPSRVEEILEEHFRGTGVLTHQIWALLTFEIWCRLYLDGERRPEREGMLSRVGLP